MQLIENATLIAGPTASGKSALALQIAEEKDGILINADSMQVYDVLRVLTARPSEDEEAQAPHHLYGQVHPSETYSTGKWFRDAEELLGKIDRSRHIVFVGGTGLYFNALLGGLSPVPEIEPGCREHWRQRLLEEGPGPLHQVLMERDPDLASQLKPADGQRIARALEVLDSTGKSLRYWQSQKGRPLVDRAKATKLVINPETQLLNERIEKRFETMVEQGALDEVRALLALDLDPAMPAMKAIGVKQIADYLEGKTTLEEVLISAKTATRQYAKRQRTWFRNQFGSDWQVISLLRQK